MQESLLNLELLQQLRKYLNVKKRTKLATIPLKLFQKIVNLLIQKNQLCKWNTY